MWHSWPQPILHEGAQSERIDVFDVYCQTSIKVAERLNQAADNTSQYKKLVGGVSSGENSCAVRPTKPVSSSFWWNNGNSQIQTNAALRNLWGKLLRIDSKDQCDSGAALHARRSWHPSDPACSKCRLTVSYLYSWGHRCNGTLFCIPVEHCLSHLPKMWGAAPHGAHGLPKSENLKAQLGTASVTALMAFMPSQVATPSVHLPVVVSWMS